MDRATKSKMIQFIYLARALKEIASELEDTGLVEFPAYVSEFQLKFGIEEFANLFGHEIETNVYSPIYSTKEVTINGVKLWQTGGGITEWTD